jgi:hypothetical protein
VWPDATGRSGRVPQPIEYRMSDELKRFMVRLAGDPAMLAEFMRAPRTAMDHAGLLPEEQDVVMSGDQGRIYAAIKGLPPPPPSPAPPPPQLPTVVSTMLQPQGQPAAAPAAQPQPVHQAMAAGQPVYYAAPGQPLYYIVGWPYWPQQ